MADRKGKGLLMVWADVPAEKEDDFNNWYNQEHIPELVGLPGVLNAARYEAIRGGPKHLACYELEDSTVVESDAFKNRPRSDWANRASAPAIATTLLSCVYQMIYPTELTPQFAQSDMAPVLQVGRMETSAVREEEWHRWYNTVFVPNFEKVPGCLRGRRWRAVRGEPKFAVVYDLESEKVPESPEWQQQLAADPRNTEMRGLMNHGPGSPGLWKKTFQL